MANTFECTYTGIASRDVLCQELTMLVHGIAVIALVQVAGGLVVYSLAKAASRGNRESEFTAQ